MLGPYDLLARVSLTSRAGVVVHGNYVDTDPIVQMIPWTTLNWNSVHHGFLPLWNPYNGLGLPLAFNWQSAAFGVPSLIGYLFPIRYAYTVGVIATLLIAGTGAYFLGRVLRLGFLGAIMVATVFELSGPLVAWLGYPQAQVMSWGGWLFAAGILVVRGERRICFHHALSGRSCVHHLRRSPGDLDRHDGSHCGPRWRPHRHQSPAVSHGLFTWTPTPVQSRISWSPRWPGGRSLRRCCSPPYN